jgi:hypothetical protein
MKKIFLTLFLLSISISSTAFSSTVYPFVARRTTASGGKEIMLDTNAIIFMFPRANWVSHVDTATVKVACTYSANALYEWKVVVSKNGRYSFVESSDTDSLVYGMEDLPLFANVDSSAIQIVYADTFLCNNNRTLAGDLKCSKYISGLLSTDIVSFTLFDIGNASTPGTPVGACAELYLKTDSLSVNWNKSLTGLALQYTIIRKH